MEEAILLMLIVDDGNQQMSNEELIIFDDLTLAYAKRNGYAHLSRVHFISCLSN